MLKRERQVYIIHQVNLHNKVLSADLSQHINVSDDIIRRDLQERADAGKLMKVHSDAKSPDFHRGRNSSKGVHSYQQKKIFARKAASLIKDGMFVLTTRGSTIIEVARALPPSLNATLISRSAPAIFEYMHHPNINVIVIGEKISRNSKMQNL